MALFSKIKIETFDLDNIISYQLDNAERNIPGPYLRKNRKQNFIVRYFIKMIIQFMSNKIMSSNEMFSK